MFVGKVLGVSDSNKSRSVGIHDKIPTKSAEHYALKFTLESIFIISYVRCSVPDVNKRIKQYLIGYSKH